MAEKIKNFINYYVPPVVWAIAIFSVSGGKVPVVSQVYWQDFVVHKTAHIIEYSLLGILIYRALRHDGVNKNEAIIYAITLCAFYGTTDEIHQSLTPGRTPRLRDVFIDTIGASVGIFIIWKLLPKMPKKLLNWAKKLELL